MKKGLRLAFLSAASITVATLAASPWQDASASSSYDSQYGYERTWNAALRLVVVDLSFKVNEKDHDSGYILFDYKSSESGGKASPGSFELVRGSDATQPIHVIAQLPAMPRYHEQVLLDELARKLRTEYGEPIIVKKQAPVEDAGTDSGDTY